MSPISFIKQALTFLFPLILLSTQVLADTWAVLIASSNGFWNYRHQADIFHSYHVLVNNGVNPAKIILFAFNDIVNDPNNPYPGQLFNIPSYNNPVDVYAGIQVDYNTTQVTSTNFLNVLMGNTSAGLPKVLKSTKDDNVFIYFVDHGVTGGLMFPNGVLWADQLIQTLSYMNNEGMYGNLVFYVEACNSGSIFS
jgi:legumain